ncbi:MAG: hypothetical protein GQ533_03570 [Methanosarcinaceae archaeon]|nr:hypothetical protein [Methanosarcinaceae archaeon]
MKMNVYTINLWRVAVNDPGPEVWRHQKGCSVLDSVIGLQKSHVLVQAQVCI